MEMLQPLTGTRVLDFTEGVAGPFATQYLGDLGADVIKIERLAGDWGRTLGTLKHGVSTQYIALNRSKRNISLNMKDETGKEIIEKLIKSADIMIASFRPGVMEKNGLGYDDVKKMNPDIIYGRISGYGYSGPLKTKTGVDTIIQANSGVMNYIGEPDKEPYRVGFPLIDHTAARDLVAGLLSAYIHRLKYGKLDGPIDVSLYATAAALQAQQWQDFYETGVAPMRVGNKNPVIVPSAVYITADHKHISIAAVRDDQFARLCQVIGRPELANEEKFKTNMDRVRHRQELEEILEAKVAQKTRDEWLKLLESADIMAAPIYNMKDISQQPDLDNAIPKVRFRLTGVDEEMQSVGLPFIYNNVMESKSNQAPAYLGEHSYEILKELGYTDNEIQKFEQQEIVRLLITEETLNG